MNRFYHAALAESVTQPPLREFDINAGYAMIYKGLAKGHTRRHLYDVGVGKDDMMVGRVTIGENGIMSTLTNFLVDVGHIGLMLGGLYLLFTAMFH